MMRRGFRNRKLDPKTSALLAGVFLREALEVDAGLVGWLSTNLDSLDEQTIEAFLVGLRARGGSKGTVNDEQMRPTLRKLLFDGTKVMRVNIAHLFGRFAQQLSPEESERLLRHASGEEREAFAWGIHYSNAVSTGWHLQNSEIDETEEEENESAVPTWRYFVERGFQLAPNQRLIDGQIADNDLTMTEIADDDIPF